MLTLALLGLTFPLLPTALDALISTAIEAMTAFRSG
jgi:flagellar biosynthetic protein FliR